MTMSHVQETLKGLDLIAHHGQITSVWPTFIEADGPNVALGSMCNVQLVDGSHDVLAEVVKVDRKGITLSPFETASTFVGARVTALPRSDRVGVGASFFGRAIDPLGRPLDGGAAIFASETRPLVGPSVSPLARSSPPGILETGVRAIDGILRLAVGQRIGVFASSGVGKTTLMTQLAQQVQVDRMVVCLVGERGREAESFWNSLSDPVARGRTTLVAATADQSAAMRVRAAHYALALAEHERDAGRHVLLILDSMTRLAMAMREIGLAAGEPATVRAYTPSVFAAIPKLIERCGALKVGGAVSAVVTVLTETDDVDDPVAELMKSILDGHLVLSRDLAERGHYPAIDVPRSISRLARQTFDPVERALASEALAQLAAYESSKTLVEAGLYARGANRVLDQALDRREGLLAFLQQAPDERFDMHATRQALHHALGGHP